MPRDTKQLIRIPQALKQISSSLISLFFHDEKHRNDLFFKGAQFPKTHFDDLTDDYPFSTTTKAPITISRYPMIIPKLKGLKINKGSIFQKEVQESLKKYHPAALACLRFFFLIRTKHFYR